MPRTLRCDPRLFQKDLSGRVYIVTGANSGTGLATSAQLLRQGAHVVGACRRVPAGEAAFADLARLPGSAEIRMLDLASLDSVRRFAEDFLARHERLDALVNNAGLVTAEGRSEDGLRDSIRHQPSGSFPAQRIAARYPESERPGAHRLPLQRRTRRARQPAGPHRF